MSYEVSTFDGFNNLYLDTCIGDGQCLSTVTTKSSSMMLYYDFLRRKGIQSPLDVDKHVLEQYKRELPTYISSISNLPLDKATIRNRITAVRTCYARLTELDVFEHNPFESVKSPKAPKKLPTCFLSSEEIQLVLEETSHFGKMGIRDRAILEIFYGTAIRRNELVNLTIHDIDWQGSQLLVRKGKGEKTRYTPMSTENWIWLSLYLTLVRPGLVKPDSGNALFLNNRGHRFQPCRMSELSKKYLRRAGFDVNAACNVFRHSAATHMLENHADIRVIQVYLGHEDISTTQVYTKVVDTFLKQEYKNCHPSAMNKPRLCAQAFENYGITDLQLEQALGISGHYE
ncbi:tyrosine-type recombinase/integrase [Pseudoalteromonas sp. T1lg122]|uniref:tyrosine-type recombinase/integrase n=1 Tax=Pseudoalteromonas sp. T1lg122 TaxID=2077094 RepID=UPI000CF65EE7|nr:tyrosine-type recombinase/integrase [Pseudoalteromonas sp. T1lg122]